MLKFQNVTKSFKDGQQVIEAVKPTTLEFSPGELIAIVGPSGSGKSTFLTMAGALQKPTSGDIIIGTQKITDLSQKALARVRMQQIGFILQTSNLVPFLTVKQQFQLLKKRKKDVMAQQDFDALIQQLGLESVMNQLPSEISGGQKQRVAIAKAIYTNPDIILADEPTASLDTENAMSVMEILKNESKRRNKMCMIVTHDERLTAYCDKVFEMKDGVLTEK
ncbi:ABC transporter ATP-binding protein [Staphylococcus pseudintermedius]|uniref:Putative hemin import ATP-binding protein HrtA n=2 Tax=Staphylococcus pseudintermedius TaxID=283734 RepID=A0A166QPX7_STAPS|nr:ABC transporter ATP-binding protein [Staphylococcus pseudintermedius]ANQ80714.1 peptide ABC transporter ATP-binding protein [Staphylococcus pseudintermedius]ANQ87305.1 peptide ABC transporter ATP-binding protein [Staphylococcus pseudintermedius]ANS88401.1 ABC transporter ATP-binding protein [Staphylococcus pseudintermedius]ASQ49571.1 peptide ABC transporter ATP-binding protein [Staphylococcus pseudintermedius]AYG55572.1 ABC transporter ATP-binding protein [Staphylococcus pseudintermedius]